MRTALAGANLGRTAIRLLAVVPPVVVTLVVLTEAPAAAVGPSSSGTRFLIEACANDHAVMAGGGCEENDEPANGWTSHSDSISSTEGGVHSSGNLSVTTQTTPEGFVVTATGNGGLTSSVADGNADINVGFQVEIAVGDQPVQVDVTGTLVVSGSPCTDSPVRAGVSPGDGSAIEVTCPGPGQSVGVQYAAAAGTTITFGGSVHGGLNDEAKTTQGSFQVQLVIASCTHTGTPGDDTLTGSAGPDVICGLGGNDTLRGLGGDDRLVGGNGVDVLFGGADDDTLEAGSDFGELSFGGPGNDTITGGTWQLGGSGRDFLEGNDTDQAAFGCGERDTITGAGGDDQLHGDRPAVSDADLLSALGLTGQPSDVDCESSAQVDGADTILGNADDDGINGGPGDDLLVGGPGLDKLIAGTGVANDDLLLGGPGQDTLEGGRFMLGGSGPDTMVGSDTRNAMYGCGAKDTMKGMGADDFIVGGGTGNPDLQYLQIHGITGLSGDEVGCSPAGEKDTKDIIKGGGGHDEIEAGDGNDDVDGEGGDDDIKGQDGDDHLRGGIGRDKLRGGGDDDNLAGNKAFDIMSGQGGQDTLLANDGVKDEVRGGGKKDKAKVDQVDEVTGVETFL